MEVTQTGWKEVWYCTKCRIVDERIVETQPREETHDTGTPEDLRAQ